MVPNRAHVRWSFCKKNSEWLLPISSLTCLTEFSIRFCNVLNKWNMSVSFGFILNKAEVWLMKHLIFMSSNIFPLLVEYFLLKNTFHWPVSNKWIVRCSFHLKNNYFQTSLTQTRSFPVSFVREVCVYKQLKLQKLQIILLWPEAKFLLNWYHKKMRLLFWNQEIMWSIWRNHQSDLNDS